MRRSGPMIVLRVMVALATGCALPAATAHAGASSQAEGVQVEAAPVDAARPQPAAAPSLLAALNGPDGVSRIVEDLVRRCLADVRLAPRLKGTDGQTLSRWLSYRLCQALDGGCAAQPAPRSLAFAWDADAEEAGLVLGHLQAAMTREGVPPRVQNRLLSRLLAG